MGRNSLFQQLLIISREANGAEDRLVQKERNTRHLLLLYVSNVWISLFLDDGK